jgi:hypothetical protein
MRLLTTHTPGDEPDCTPPGDRPHHRHLPPNPDAEPPRRRRTRPGELGIAGLCRRSCADGLAEVGQVFGVLFCR